VLLFVPDDSADVVEELSRYFIGVRIKSVPFSNLTQNQDLTSLIINSVSLEGNATLMSDLAYFNFMTQKGIVVDLVSKTPIHPLLFEADKAGLRTMKRQDIVAFYDYESLRAVYSDVEKCKDEFFQNYLEIETIDQ
jgi:shikimate 5-dehydrogenase